MACSCAQRVIVQRNDVIDCRIRGKRDRRQWSASCRGNRGRRWQLLVTSVSNGACDTLGIQCWQSARRLGHSVSRELAGRHGELEHAWCADMSQLNRVERRCTGTIVLFRHC